MFVTTIENLYNEYTFQTIIFLNLFKIFNDRLSFPRQNHALNLF